MRIKTLNGAYLATNKDNYIQCYDVYCANQEEIYLLSRRKNRTEPLLLYTAIDLFSPVFTEKIGKKEKKVNMRICPLLQGFYEHTF
jgi:hypothetical protein